MDLSGSVMDVFKSTDDVINRVFNHKPFLEAQLQTMVKKFDDCQISIPRDELLNINQSIITIKDKSLPSISDKCDNLTKTLDRASRIDEMMSKLLDSEKSKELDRKFKLSETTSKENNDLVKFMEQMNLQIDEIDHSYMNAKKDIESKYKSFK